MSKYALILCVEREITCLGVFEELKDAQDAMKKDFDKYHFVDIGLSKEEFEEDCESECAIEKMSAYSNVDDDQNVDWKIIDISEKPATLEQWKQKQIDGVSHDCRICPRCGGDMRNNLYHNSLSRIADIYICPECGMKEALESVPGAAKTSIEDWYYKPLR